MVDVLIGGTKERLLEKRKKERDDEQARLKAKLQRTEEEVEGKKKELISRSIDVVNPSFEALASCGWPFLRGEKKERQL